MKKPQWITIFSGIGLVILISFFGRTIPKKKVQSLEAESVSSGNLTTDSILALSKKRISSDQAARLNMLEHSISRGDVKEQQLKVYHQLAHFWRDSAELFEPYAWYEAEAARLENSEKSLTFAAHLFLENLQADQVTERVKWKALQAKDLFERSLIINPKNDSSKIGLGACYLFGDISATPMVGINKIREVVDRDSNNVFAQWTLAKGSLRSGQLDKAIERLKIVNRLQPDNPEAMLLLADVFDRMRDKTNAIAWYQKSLQYIQRQEARSAIEKRIDELKGK